MRWGSMQWVSFFVSPKPLTAKCLCLKTLHAAVLAWLGFVRCMHARFVHVHHGLQIEWWTCDKAQSGRNCGCALVKWRTCACTEWLVNVIASTVPESFPQIVAVTWLFCCLVRSRRHTCFVDTTSDIDASMYCVQSKYTLILTHPHIHTLHTSLITHPHAHHVHLSHTHLTHSHTLTNLTHTLILIWGACKLQHISNTLSNSTYLHI